MYAQDLQSTAAASSLISLAVQHCLTLKLNRLKTVKSTVKSEQESHLLQRLFWAVYSLEKPLAMRLGRSSVHATSFP